ncbi:3',5'-cyclic adenosine monophosphate phosphodiesterase CpdA [Rubrobacter xylanophilus DSM 9941]|uniref:metallophosphoesterase family protein n=1 Tax=Rubrobacter xylanophilus TaxID=49319 RepID=UPI001C63D0C8|nr:metallophosphoesterase [Rubrobacter xylanophilus]QYJ16358.1 3',5'-cyclic adenosine monophosphate phosphodiesterase CpdA [Rubrobacter xylanophilus DSM 9941]
MTRIVHISDLHFGKPAAHERLEALKDLVSGMRPAAVAVSGDLTQRCANREFEQARSYLKQLERSAPCIVVPGNHDIRWLGAVARNLGFAGFFRRKAHEFKYSRYRRYICNELNPLLEIPGAVIAGLNTAHGISRGSLTRRLKDLGVIGHVRRSDVERVRRLFEQAPPGAARVVMIHHNPIKGPVSGRHGLANTEWALEVLASIGTELILCGHDHQEAIHAIERSPGLVISTAGTISNRVRPGRSSSFNLVDVGEESLRIVTYTWSRDMKNFLPSTERLFPRPHRPGRYNLDSMQDDGRDLGHVEQTDPRR